jgi:hypothetical protein
VFRRIYSSPVLFAQPFEIEDRQWFPGFENLGEQMGNLLRDRAMLAFGPSLQLAVERVGEVLDVQDGHWIPPLFLHLGGRLWSYVKLEPMQ